MSMKSEGEEGKAGEYRKMAGWDLPYGTGYMLAGPFLTLCPPSLPPFFLGRGYG